MKSKTVKMLIVIAIVAVAVVLAFVVDWKGLFAKKTVDDSTQLGAATTQEGGQTGEQEEEPWLHFYNLDLQNDEDAKNDFNFGPDPTASATESSAEYYNGVFYERLKRDPALAAATMAWIDANLGTRYLGEFYETCGEDWAKTINAKKTQFAGDQLAFYQSLDALFELLGKAESVDLRECKNVTDYMYMNPATVDGIPDVIVLKTTEHTGDQLVYTFVIKNEKIEVAFRVNCGFQPTDVAKVPVKSTYTPPKNPTPSTTPTPTPSTTPTPTPNPTPSTTPDNPKDPDKAPDTNTEPNDDKGPGNNTNNPANPNVSTEDKPTNSNHYDSYDDYRKDMDDLAQTNAEQKVGGDSNTPSTPVTAGTTVDSNADNGTGNGGIDTPTAVQPVVHDANTGNTISTPGGAWGGPPD